MNARKKGTQVPARYADVISELLTVDPRMTVKPMLSEIRRRFGTDGEPHDWPGDDRLKNKIDNCKKIIRIRSGRYSSYSAAAVPEDSSRISQPEPAAPEEESSSDDVPERRTKMKMKIEPEMDMDIDMNIEPMAKRRISAIAAPLGSTTMSTFTIEPPPRKKRPIMTEADIKKHCIWNTTTEKNNKRRPCRR